MDTPVAPKFWAYTISKLSNPNPDPKVLLGYIVKSTARINIEDSPRKELEDSSPLFDPDPQPTLQEIAAYLVRADHPEITIFIHGYAINHRGARERTEKIYDYAQQICPPQNHVLLGYLWPSENPIQDDSQFLQPPASVLQKIRFALQSLPTALMGTLVATLLLALVNLVLVLGLGRAIDGTAAYLFLSTMTILPAVIALVLLGVGDAAKLLPSLPLAIGLVSLGLTWLSRQSWQQVFLPLGLALSGFGFVLIFTLIALRLVAYFRDQYRASNYAVLDLVEVIRQLDQKLFQTGSDQGLQESDWILAAAAPQPLSQAEQRQDSPQGPPDSQNRSPKPRVKLNILGHSMGCFVATQVVRILSDVFDPRSIAGNPDAGLGKTLQLGRLVLVAADIPTESIMPGRSNFLQTSLRRCEEAYLFTNEGDLALRLASTAANYFSFPSRTRFLGYRLGNVTAKHFKTHDQRRNFGLKPGDYGIVNWDHERHSGPATVAALASSPGVLLPLHEHLEIRSSNQEHRSLQELLEIRASDQGHRLQGPNSLPLCQPDERFSQKSLVNSFTVFDCTDYRDYKLLPGTPIPPDATLQPIVSQTRRQAALNLLDYLFLSIDYFVTHRLDTHGGYFQGQLSQQLMYDLVFLGFAAHLQGYGEANTAPTPEQQLQHFADLCRQKQLQVLLSPQRISLPVAGHPV